MATIAVIARGDNAFAFALTRALRQLRPALDCDLLELPNPSFNASEGYVYVPTPLGPCGMVPDVTEAETLFQQSRQFEGKKFILLSSALIYGTGPGRLSLVSEDYVAAAGQSHSIADQWKLLESLASRYLQPLARLIILRPTTVLPSPALLSRRLLRRITLALPGHDPVVQSLKLTDLAEAILCALDHNAEGIFNVAPDDVVPLHTAIRVADNHRFPLPRILQRLAVRAAALEYLRYPWTVSNKKIKQQLGFSSPKWSVMAIPRRTAHPTVIAPRPSFDEFGMDRDYIQFFGRTLFKFLSNWYWRIEVKGLEHVPREGKSILVGTHRGFMPWDAVMALHQVNQRTGRVPRFLAHPGLLKFPFISNFVRKLGAVIACQESADRILGSDELLGVFPEGVQGAFALYRQAYKLKSFGRDSFVKLALRHRAPIIPFVTVGSAEILPIFARIKSRLWTRYADWPCIPVSTFPLIPVPLPSKWHTQFLPAIHLEQQYGPEAAEDARLVKSISQEVKNLMQQAVDEILSRRKSRFFGSVFGHKEPL